MEIKEGLRRMELEYEDVHEESEYEEEFEVEEMMLPRVSTWINAADVTILQGMVAMINDGGCPGDAQNNRCEFDVCLICFETWTSHGDHQLWYENHESLYLTLLVLTYSYFRVSTYSIYNFS